MNNIDEELKNMEETLRRLRVEYQIFLFGNRKSPPEDMKLRLEKISKHLSDRADMTQAQRFRFNTVLTRFYTYRSLWRRIVHEKEFGKETREETSAVSDISRENAPEEKLRLSLSDPNEEEDKIKSLYDALLHHNQKHPGKLSFSYQQFSRFLAEQTRNIRKKHGCTRVTYSVVLDGDVIRFTAAADKS
jgi:hypothetical protein